MRLLHLQVTNLSGAPARGVSVWVDTDDSAHAHERARSVLAAAGWTVVAVDSDDETTTEDYFQPCPSQQAFTRAQAEGLAWRFDDE